ncbi:DedA family protein [Amylibacter sp. SFDW26]|uniref:YqaA family protein n=1 Tax=Amylibacter sp. SFDW26 TaxID=2652722 RepID=UPI00126220A2|nr:YqaA family protein [Amylibacter sp. SFDW26]KAB7615774.1 DedA family protein [Amylibacter sp. SFDW26]
MGDLSAYLGLFLSAFVAATILPAQSETVLGVMLALGKYSPALLITVASVGNVLGSMVNYVLGRLALSYRHKRWFPAKPQTLERAQGWYSRYGRWSLLLSWVPLIGDPITVAAGVMREPFWRFLVLVTIAKVGRYVVLAGVVLNLGKA